MMKMNGILGQGLWFMTSVIALGLLTLSGCTPSTPSTSKLGISIPATISKGAQSLDKQSNLSLSHVVVNVTGSGITSPIVYVWDQCHGCITPLAVPIHYIEVPTGTDRLVQALAVYGDQSGGTSVYYGDAVASLSKSEETLSISTSSIFTGSTLISGSIAGRYMTTTSTGPTGSLEIRYQPPNDRPALILEKTEIVNGWFSALGVKGIAFRYVVAGTGQDLFGKAVDLADSVFTPSDRVANVFHPVYSYNDKNGNLVNSNEAERHVIGYFGPGASGKLVCHKFSGSDSLDGHFQRGTITELTVAVLSGAAVVPTDGELTSTNSPQDHVSIKGGLDANAPDNNCSTRASADGRAANLYSNFLPLTVDNFREGRSGIGGFNGVFGRVKDIATVNSNLVAFDVGDGTVPMIMFEKDDVLQVGGKVLPGIDAFIKGIKFFKIPNSMMNVDDVQMAPCSEFSKVGNSFGALELSSVALDSVGRFFGPSGYDTVAMTESAHLGICFLAADGSLYKNGYILSSDKMGGGGGNQGPYLRLEYFDKYLRAGTAIRPLTFGKCYPGELKIFDNSEPYTLAHGNLVADFSGYPSFEVFLSSSECDTNTAKVTSGTIMTGTGSLAVWIRPTGTLGTAPFSMTLNSSDGVSYNSDGAFSLARPIAKTNLPTQVAAGGCYPFTVDFMDADEFDPRPVAGTFGISYTNGNVFSTPGCTGTTVTQGTLATPSYRSGTYYISAPANATQGTLSLSNTAGLSQFTFRSQVLTAASGSTMDPIGTRIVLNATATTVGQCLSGQVEVVNSSGQVVPTVSDMSVTLNPQGLGTFFSEPGCSSSLSNNQITISAGSYFNKFWYMPSVVGSGLTLRGDDTNSDPVLSSGTIAVTLPSGSYVALNPENIRQSPLIGSHEFLGTGSSGSFAVSIFKSGTDFSCYDNYGDCSSQIDTVNNKLWINYDDVFTNKSNEYRIQAKNSSSSQSLLLFRPSDLFNPDFVSSYGDNIVTCGSSFSASAAPTVSAGSLNTGVNCLGRGVSLDLGTTGFGFNQKSIVGSAYNRNPVISPPPSGDVFSDTAIGSGGVLANLAVTMGSMNTSGIIATTSPVSVKGVTVIMAGTSDTSRGISLFRSSDASDILISTLSTLGVAKGTGIYLDVDSVPDVTLNRVKVDASNGHPALFNGTIVNTGPYGGSAAISGMKFAGSGNGLILVAPSGAESGASVSVTNVSIETGANGGLPVSINGLVDLILNTFFLKTSAANAVLRMETSYLFGGSAAIDVHATKGRFIGTGELIQGANGWVSPVTFDVNLSEVQLVGGTSGAAFSSPGGTMTVAPTGVLACGMSAVGTGISGTSGITPILARSGDVCISP